MCAERGAIVHSVLDRLDHKESLTTSTVLSNASAYGVQGYVDSLSTLVAMHLLDRSCVCIENNLFSMQHFPTVASEPGLCVDDMHK